MIFRRNKINLFFSLLDLFNSNLEQTENGIDESEKDHQTLFDMQRTSFVKARDKINRSITTLKVRFNTRQDFHFRLKYHWPTYSPLEIVILLQTRFTNCPKILLSNFT